jgi:16S rRNA (adenine1518-N6/adenine1519-N6)-dimethyltransferase
VTLSPRQVRELLDEHGLAPSRALGQNFVADPNTVRRIAALAEVGPGDRVVEVGPGLGSLTLALAETGASVVAVEIDRHLVPVLRSVVEPVGVRVVEGDARKVDWATVLAEGDTGDTGDGGAGDAGEAAAGSDRPPWALVANLPYNIATPLVLDLLAGVPAIGRMLVMVQREVGERLAARVGDAGYGIPSVKVAYWGVASVVGRVPATVFVPQPKVESALVRIVRHPADGDGHGDGRAPGLPDGWDDADRARLFRLVDAGFGQRRKMLRRSLAGLVDPSAFAAAGVRPEARAEELDLPAWSRLASAAATMGS